MGTGGNWRERTTQFTNGYSHCATNEHCQSDTRRLFGGTASFMTHKVTHRAIQHGRDHTGLGRWSWTILRGRDNIVTRIITGYRPCRSFTDNALTVYAQHELYFRQHGEWRDPRTAFFEDIDILITGWIAAGEQIVLGFDVNADIRLPEIDRWRHKWNLCAPLSRLHGVPQVSTCSSNTTQTPIDCVWASYGLTIVDGGMTGFGEIDLGNADHRLLWIDIDESSIFGFRPSPPAKRPNDSILLHDPKVVRKYNNYVYRERTTHRIGEKVLALEKKAQTSVFTPEDAASYERLLLLDSGIRTQAKKKCRQFLTGQVPYSDVIGRDRKEIHLWDMIISRRQGKRTDTRAIRRLMVQTGTHTALQHNLEEAEQLRAACLQTYLSNKKRAQELYTNFRLKVCRRRAAKYRTTVEAQEKIFHNNRTQSRSFQKINHILQRKERHAITTVEYTLPDPSDGSEPQIRICYSKDAIEDACAQEGQRRFNQSADSPFLRGSLLQDLGFLATQSTVDFILNGTYECQPDVDQYTRDFIAQLAMPTPIAESPMITGFVSTADHVAGWKKMKSSIASSPFGPVFSDYIAASDDIRIADIDAAFATIPVITGYCPNAWKKAVDVMIPKKTTSAHVTKLRIIVLFHAMFNMINKNIGRKAVRMADEHKLIPAEAYGSRPGRRANICALNKVLTYDILRQRRLPAALCSNDAVSCYDRIVHAIASICLQRMGVDAATCRLMFGTLQEIEHYVATAYGVSTTSYGAIEIPLQGVGQGNGAGPAIWLIMTIPLINMLREKGFGFRSKTVLSGEEYRFVCYTFVDDTDTIHSTTDLRADHRQVLTDMQLVIDTWEGGLRATGGALSAAKSYWYLLEFKWIHSRQKWEYCTIQETPGDVTIVGNSPTGARSPLTRHPTHHAEETLGLWIAPDANQIRQVDAMHDKIAAWCDKIRTRHLSHSLAWLSITSGISMALKYPLTATSLTKKDCKLISKPFLDVALPALGLPRTMPHAVVFAPKRYLGFGIFDIWVQQAVDQIQACLDYGHRKDGDITGHLLRDITETLRLELGLPNSPFGYSYQTFYLCTTPTKLHTIWEFCSDNGLVLEDGHPPTPHLREDDCFLMEVFSTAGYSPKELRMLNRCRMTLQVTRLSEIVTGDGLSLQPHATERRDPFCQHIEYSWPKQGTPDAQSWRLWRDALIDCFLLANTTSLRLAHPLGRWHHLPPKWQWFYSPTTTCVYRKVDHLPLATYRCSTSGHATRRPQFRLSDSGPLHLPPSAVPTTTFGSETTIRYTGHSTVVPLAGTDQDNWWGVVIDAPTNLQLFAQGIRDGTAISVADGSFKDAFGTAGYIILPSIHSTDSFTLVNQTPGTPSDMDPYRAELGGIYGIVATTNYLCTSLGINSGAMIVGCDCESALRNLTSVYEPSPDRPHHDLLTAIRYLVATSPIQWTYRHVRGHQDDHTSYSRLDRWAQLNIDMDNLAKSYWRILDNHRPEPFSLQSSPGQWSIWHNGTRLPCWTLSRAQEIYYHPIVKTFWDKRLSCTNATRRYDWPSSALALRRLPTTQRLWVPKWLCSTLPTGNNLVRWGQPDLSACPRCGEDENHRHHVVSCQHAGAAIIREKLIDKLEDFLVISATHPDLRTGLLTLIDAAIHSTPWQPPTPTMPGSQNTFADQQILGTGSVLDGFLSPHWASTQHAHYEYIGRRTTGTQWAGRVIRRIWEIAWQLWLHRRLVQDSIENCNLSRLHLTLDDAIDDAYLHQHTSPDRSLHRWFHRPACELHAESLDWKRRWLEMIRADNPTP